MGTPGFAVEPLRAILAAGFNVVGVITAPDKPAGRGLSLSFSAVKQFALEHQLNILQPEKLKDAAFQETLKALQPDVQVVVAFRMLPESVWSLPTVGTFNLHASLLPHYRGAAPINWAVINGETETGVSTFFIEHEIDTGKIIFQEKVAIEPADNAGIVHDKLMETGSALVVKTLKAIEQGNYPQIPQQMPTDGVLKAAPKLFTDTCRIDWNQKAESIHNLIRGLSPYPAAFTTLVKEEKTFTLKIFASQFDTVAHQHKPGTLVSDRKKFLKIATPDGFISVLNLQMQGKKRLDIEEFLRGMQQIESFCCQ